MCILPLLKLFQPFGFLQIGWQSYWKNKFSTYLHLFCGWDPWALRRMKELFLESRPPGALWTSESLGADLGPSGPYLGGPFKIKKSRLFPNGRRRPPPSPPTESIFHILRVGGALFFQSLKAQISATKSLNHQNFQLFTFILAQGVRYMTFCIPQRKKDFNFHKFKTLRYMNWISVVKAEADLTSISLSYKLKIIEIRNYSFSSTNLNLKI